MPDGIPEERLRQVIEYIRDNLADSLPLATLAGIAHLSRYRFAHLFKASAGLAPHQYVVAQRVERARQLILAGNLPLAEIATRVGFTSQAHLTRHFKRIVGVTPATFRRGHESQG